MTNGRLLFQALMMYILNSMDKMSHEILEILKTNILIVYHDYVNASCVYLITMHTFPQYNSHVDTLDYC